MHTTDWLPDGARLWLPSYLAWFVGGMVLAALQPLGVRAYALVCVPLAIVSYFIVSTPIAGEPTTSPAGLREALVKTAFYAVIATLVVAPLALRGHQGVGGSRTACTRGRCPAARWCSSVRSPMRSS